MSGLQSVRQNLGTLMLSTSLLLSLGFNVYFGWEIEELKHPSTSVEKGLKFPTLAVISADGTKSRLSLSGTGPTVIYYLSPQCAWCTRNRTSVAELAARTPGYRWIGLSRGKPEDLAVYLKEHPSPFPIYIIDDEMTADELGLLATPITVVLDNGSKVDASWTGAYIGTRKSAVEAYFKVKLPQLTAPAKAEASKGTETPK